TSRRRHTRWVSDWSSDVCPSDLRAAVVSSIAHVGPVMVTAGLIAAAGFASLATFDVNSIRVFGLLMAAGIVSALAIEMTFIPAVRALMPAPRLAGTVEPTDRRLTAALRRIADVVLRRPRALLAPAVPPLRAPPP